MSLQILVNLNKEIHGVATSVVQSNFVVTVMGLRLSRGQRFRDRGIAAGTNETLRQESRGRWCCQCKEDIESIVDTPTEHCKLEAC